MTPNARLALRTRQLRTMLGLRPPAVGVHVRHGDACLDGTLATSAAAPPPPAAPPQPRRARARRRWRRPLCADVLRIMVAQVPAAVRADGRVHPRSRRDGGALRRAQVPSLAPRRRGRGAGAPLLASPRPLSRLTAAGAAGRLPRHRLPGARGSRRGGVCAQRVCGVRRRGRSGGAARGAPAPRDRGAGPRPLCLRVQLVPPPLLLPLPVALPYLLCSWACLRVQLVPSHSCADGAPTRAGRGRSTTLHSPSERFDTPSGVEGPVLTYVVMWWGAGRRFIEYRMQAAVTSGAELDLQVVSLPPLLSAPPCSFHVTAVSERASARALSTT